MHVGVYMHVIVICEDQIYNIYLYSVCEVVSWCAYVNRKYVYVCMLGLAMGTENPKSDGFLLH